MREMQECPASTRARSANAGGASDSLGACASGGRRGVGPHHMHMRMYIQMYIFTYLYVYVYLCAYIYKDMLYVYIYSECQ